MHDRPVRLGNMVLRVREFIEKVAIVRQEDQPLGIRVETPHRAQHRIAHQVHKVRHQSGGVDIAARADDAARLVQRDVIAPGGRAHDMPVKCDLVFGGVYFGAEFGDDLPVDADAALFNPRFAGPARADSGGGEDLLETLPRPRGVGRWISGFGSAGRDVFSSRRF